ncbi:MAG: thioredoxin family protein [Lutibacter sp.]
MKKLFFVLLIPVVCSAQGINFHNNSFEELLAKAKQENKILFLDAYAEWCVPCKNLSRNVFPETSVGEFFNANFINTKIDMEYDEGPSIAYDYNVTAYPTLLFIDGNGKLLHKAVGFQNPEQLIEVGKMALNPETQLYTQIDRFIDGTIDPESLYTVVVGLMSNQDEDANIYARAYYKTQENLLTSNTIGLMYESMDGPESFEFDFLQKNEAEAEKLVPGNYISDKLDYIVLVYAIELNTQNVSETIIIENMVSDVEKTVLKFRPNKAKDIANYFGMVLSEKENDFISFEKYALVYLEVDYKSKKPEILNGAAWHFYEHSENKESLEKALSWAIESVAKESIFSNNDTVANLYHKLGDKNKAITYAEIAINLGREVGEDTSATEALLMKLK